MTPQAQPSTIDPATLPAEPNVAELVAELMALELPDEDGIPLENVWHRLQINLLDDCLRQLWQGRTDFFVGGNMFVYFSLQQIRNKDYKGPDFFVVKDVDGSYVRPAWVAWQEDGRLPDVIIELLSPSTQSADLGEKKRLYERVFRTAEYYCYGPDPTESEPPQLLGWTLVHGRYEPLTPNAQGWLWSNQLGVWIGECESEYHAVQTRWLRFYDREGRLVPTRAEAAEAQAAAAKMQAEAAIARAAALEAEIKRLQALLEPPAT